MSPDKNAKPNPVYEEVYKKQTDFVEVFHMKYDANIISYEELTRFLFCFHDPTTKDK